MITALQLARRKRSGASLIVALAFCAAPALAAVTSKNEASPSVSGLLLAQARAPGRPTTPEEKRKPAPRRWSSSAG